MKKNILVTATGGRSVGSGILHALTRANEGVAERWNVVAADADSFSWGLYKVDNATLLPLASERNYIDAVKNAIVKFKIDAIIPGSEPEASLLSEYKSDFDIPVITNEHSLMPLMLDKFNTTAKLIELGLPVIPTYPISKIDEALSLHDFPLIVKPTKGTGGSKGVKMCSDLNELIGYIETIPPNSGYCIQPVVGTEDDEYTVGVLSDKDGAIIDSIIMKRKLIGLSILDTKTVNKKNYSISTGYSQGFFINDTAISTFCENLAIKIGSKGPLNVQLRVHNGEIYVFEIHPRFSGTTPMRADVLFNEPDILLRNYLYNEKFGRLNHMTDVAVIRAFEHVIIPIHKMLKP
jgi:carbamoyl-phosphate synthase large subunit